MTFGGHSSHKADNNFQLNNKAIKEVKVPVIFLGTVGFSARREGRYTVSRKALGRLRIQTMLDYTLPLPCLSGRFARTGHQKRTRCSTPVNKTTQVQG